MPNFQESLGGIPGSSGAPCAVSSGDCAEVPDVSADADPYTGYVVYDAQGGESGWIDVGGTSAAAPLWAGALADIASADGAGVGGFGSLNPDLYALAASSPGTYFNDVARPVTMTTTTRMAASSRRTVVTTWQLGLGTPSCQRWQLVSPMTRFRALQT